MGIGKFIRKTRLKSKIYGPRTAFRSALSTLRFKTLGQPKPLIEPDLPDQRTLITDLFRRDDPVWLFWFDGGRYDWFEELYPEYFEGELSKCWNGEIGYTGDWSVRNLTQSFTGRGLFSNPPLRNLDNVDYDGRDHFDIAPDIDGSDDGAVRERLATLGYLEKTEDPIPIDPRETNAAVLEHQDSVNGGIVRYLKPHPPFNGLEDMTSGASKTEDTLDALLSEDLSVDELEDAYEQTYRIAFEAAAELIPELDGKS